jgi:thiol-disulfide isomerase/thioredoxin
MTTDGTSSRNGIWKALLPIAVILVLVVGGLFAIKSTVGKRPEGAVEVKVGATLPDFKLKRFGGDGGEVLLSSLPAKVLMVNFWATWCEACMVEMPSIVKLRSRYHAQGFEVLPVNVDENPEKVLPEILPELGLTFGVYHDGDGELSRIFDVHAIPLTVILDRNRKVLFIEGGERDWDDREIHAMLERWLST